MERTYEDRAHKELQIESWSNSARTLLIRGSTPGGPFAEQHVTNADRSLATDTYELHGIPTRVQISPDTAPVRRGECYVRVTLMIDGEPVQRLASAYLTDSKTLSWPPGQYESSTEGPGLIRSILGTDPAATVMITEVVPTNARWKLLGAHFRLTTDANAANRWVSLRHDDGAARLREVIIGTAHVASEVRDYMFMAGFSIEYWDRYQAGIDGQSASPLPPDFIMFQGHRLVTTLGNPQAADDFGAPRLTVEEWIEE